MSHFINAKNLTINTFFYFIVHVLLLLLHTIIVSSICLVELATVVLTMLGQTHKD